MCSGLHLPEQTRSPSPSCALALGCAWSGVHATTYTPNHVPEAPALSAGNNLSQVLSTRLLTEARVCSHSGPSVPHKRARTPRTTYAMMKERTSVRANSKTHSSMNRRESSIDSSSSRLHVSALVPGPRQRIGLDERKRAAHLVLGERAWPNTCGKRCNKTRSEMSSTRTAEAKLARDEAEIVPHHRRKVLRSPTRG